MSYGIDDEELDGPVGGEAAPEGGAIPEGESGDESAGLNTSTPPARRPQTPTSGLLEAAEDTPPVQGIRKIVSYLMGAGSMQPQQAEKLVEQVKQNAPGISDDDANLLAVHQAAEMGGPAAAWAMVQYNRMAYNAKQSFANAALNGVDGKAGDISAAAQAATQAGAHVLDGSKAIFTAAPEGITATIQMPGSTERQQYRLTPQQFKDYLDVGKIGQWDRIMEEGGIASAVSKAARASPAAGNELAGAAPQVDAGTSRPKPKTTNYGTTPSTIDMTGGEPIAENRGPGTNYGAELEARGNARFPWISQEGQRQDFMANQENVQEGRENQLRIAEAGNTAKERIAAIQGGARQSSAETRAKGEVDKQGIRSEGNRDVAKIQADARGKSDQQKALQQLAKMEQTSTDARMREKGRMARAEINNPNFLLQTQPQRDEILKKWGLSPQQTGAPQQAPTGQPQQQAAPAQQQRPPNVPAGAKLYNGQWYTRGPNGEAVPVQ